MARALGPRASVGTTREAAEFGTVLLFAVPYDALPQVGQDLKEQIAAGTMTLKQRLEAAALLERTQSTLARGMQLITKATKPGRSLDSRSAQKILSVR